MLNSRLGLALVFIGALTAASFGQHPTVVKADGICFNAGVPTPAPTRTGQVTNGVCINGILQVNAVGAGGSPLPTAAPAATPPYQIVCATTAPAGSVVCPTPIPFIVNIPGNPFGTGFGTSYTTSAFVYGYDSSSGNALPIALDPNAIPALGNALVVACYKNCGTPIPYSAASPLPISLPTSFQTAFPTPIPLPTQPYQVIIANPTALPTPVPFPTSTAPGATATPAVSSSSGTILAAGASTLGYVLCNPNAFAVYVNFGTTASTAASTLYFASFPAPCYVDRGPYRYQGIITAITASASGTMNVTTF